MNDSVRKAATTGHASSSASLIRRDRLRSIPFIRIRNIPLIRFGCRHFLVGYRAFPLRYLQKWVFTSMRAVQVEHHFIFCSFANVGIELMAFCIVQP